MALCNGRRTFKNEGPSASFPGVGKIENGYNNAAGDADAAPAPPAARRILVVDDNRDAADSLGLLLESLGWDTRVAYDGPSALETFESYLPGVVFLDIGMPGMDGYEVAQRMRRGSRADDFMLVAVTGWGQDEHRRRVKEAGFDHHLVKPVDLEALQELLRLEKR